MAGDNEVDIIIRATDAAGDILKSIAQKFTEMGGSAAKAAPYIAAIGTAVAVAGKFVADATKQTITYNLAIRDLSATTRVATEDISKIWHATEMWGISNANVKSALESMANKGISPTVDMLVQLADEYVNSTDKTAFAKEATEKYGTAWQNLLPMLQDGGQAIRDATGAVNDSLIVTDEAIQRTEDYQKATAELNDTWTAFKQNIGNAVIPAITWAIGGGPGAAQMDQLQGAWAKYNDMVGKGIVSQQDQAWVISNVNMLFGDNAQKLANLNMIMGKYENALKGATAGLVPYSNYLKTTTVSTDNLSYATGDLATAEAAADASMMAYTRSLQAAAPESGKLTDARLAEARAAYEAAVATEQYNTALGILAGTYDEVVSPAIDKYTDNMGEKMLIDAMYQHALGKLDEKELQHVRNMAESASYTQELTKLVQEGKLSWSYLFQAMEDGIVTEGELTSGFKAAGLSAEEAADLILKIKAALDALYDKTITITTRHIDIGADSNYYVPGQVSKPGDPAKMQASGADYVVPPGYPNDSWPLGYAQSGERVIIVPAGQTVTNITNNNSVRDDMDIEKIARRTVQMIQRRST